MGTKAWETRDGRAIGAWVFKANPDVFDALSHLEKYGEVTSWAVRSSYRLNLVEPGQPALLWITAGRRKTVAPGFYAFGEITEGGFFHGVGEGEDWTPEGEAAGQDLFVNLRLRPLVTPILRSEVRALEALAQIEPVKAPQMSNPNVLFVPEFRALADRWGLSTVEPTQEQVEAGIDQEVVNAVEDPLIEFYDGENACLTLVAFGDEADFQLLLLEPDPGSDDGVAVTEYDDVESFFDDRRDQISKLIADAAPFDPSADAAAVFDVAVFAITPASDPLLVAKDTGGSLRVLDPMGVGEGNPPLDRGAFGSAVDAAVAALDILAGTEDQR